MDMKLTLEPRTVTGKKVKSLRKQGLIPASICGKGIENANFQLDRKTFTLLYRQAGRTTLIELQTPSGRQSAFVRQAQIHPVSREYIHVDFRVVDLRTEITADVPIVTVGENRLIERGDALISQSLPTLHVKALPGDLPHQVEVDVSKLEEVGTTIHVSDLSLGDKVEILTPAEQAVVTLSASRMAAEVEEIAAEVEAGEEPAETPEEGAESAGESGEDSGEDENA